MSTVFHHFTDNLFGDPAVVFLDAGINSRRRRPCVCSVHNRLDDRYFSQELHPVFFGVCACPAAAEDVVAVFGQFGGREPRHVLDDARHGDVDVFVAEHLHAAHDVGHGDLLRRRDNHRGVDFQFADDRQMHVARAGREVREQEVQRPPPGLVDHLFEYALVAGDEEIELEEPELFETVFFDLFSETCNYLEQKGFTVDFDVEWVEQKISISTDYMIRIMDNVTSNIIKYAEPGEVVSIFSRKEKDRVGILFENRVRLPEEKVESNGIGIQNIKNMMKKMNGECIVEKENQEYRIILVFPYVN